MILVVQEIQVWWTKASRGGEGAVLRNTVPEIVPLVAPSKLPDPPLLLHQQVKFSEEARFQKPQVQIKTQELIPLKKLMFGCAMVRLESESDRIEVTYAYTMSRGGAPERSALPRKVFSLEADQWGKIVYNGRFSSTGSDWYYRKTVLNIGWFAQISKNIFLSAPIRTFSDMADLW